MQIDTNYLKSILEKFINSETNFISNNKFKDMIDKDFQKFAFHWELLLDKYIIVNSKGEKAKFITYGSNNNYTINLGVNVRLHDNGHEFYNILNDDNAIKKIKNKFSTLSMDILIGLSKSYIERQVNNF